MKSYQKNDLGKGGYELVITIANTDIQKQFDSLFDEALKEVSIEGFRKGKAPKDIASKQISREKVYEKVIGKVIPQAYEDVIKKENLSPVTQPQVELVNAKEGEDWIVKITIAERPKVTLGDYKKAVKEVKGDLKKDEIWVPGKDANSQSQSSQSESVSSQAESEEKKRKLLNKILDRISTDSTIEIADLIVKDEINRKMTQLLEDVKAIGMTIDDYVRSKNTSVDALRAQYEKEVTEMYKIELALEKISDDEKVTVEDSDIRALFAGIKDEKEKENAQKNAYFYATVIKRQKTLDHLLSL